MSLLVLLLATLGCVALAHLSLQSLSRHEASSWPVSEGRVTATRTRLKETRDARFARIVAVQAEILVSYNAFGKTYLRWFSLPARPDLSRHPNTDKAAQLEGTVCTVHWKQTHPFEAFVTEYQGY